MIYLAAYGYDKGDTYIIFRGVDSDGNECGKRGTAFESFPYLYFTDPIDSFTNRACVSSCPSYTGSAITTTTCGNAATRCNSNTYQLTYDTNGNIISGSYVSGTAQFLGYDTSLAIDRLCVPNSNMFTSTFSSFKDYFANAIN